MRDANETGLMPVLTEIGGQKCRPKILYCPEHMPRMDRVTRELASLDIDTHSK